MHATKYIWEGEKYKYLNLILTMSPSEHKIYNTISISILVIRTKKQKTSSFLIYKLNSKQLCLIIYPTKSSSKDTIQIWCFSRGKIGKYILNNMKILQYNVDTKLLIPCSLHLHIIITLNLLRTWCQMLTDAPLVNNLKVGRLATYKAPLQKTKISSLRKIRLRQMF